MLARDPELTVRTGEPLMVRPFQTQKDAALALDAQLAPGGGVEPSRQPRSSATPSSARRARR
jgi:hypothetical protein